MIYDQVISILVSSSQQVKTQSTQPYQLIPVDQRNVLDPPANNDEREHHKGRAGASCQTGIGLHVVCICM
jgi:hypothetical protein